jgi:hypothetical protein
MIMSMSAQEEATYAARAFTEVETLVEEAEAATELKLKQMQMQQKLF